MMNIFKFFLLIVLGTTTLFASINKGIYGIDNRKLVSELNESSEQQYLKYTPSILAQIPTYRISETDNKNIFIKTKNLKEGLNFCPNERFNELPLVSSCTAFLIAPDMIVTAGHCVKDKFDCKKNIWVLDFETSTGFSNSNDKVIFENDKIFKCAELIRQIENQKADYAVIRLDRAINDRTFLKLRTTGKIDNNEPLLIIGHPLGMPKMLADQIFIRENNLENVFKTNADAFSGNSGSPVIGINTGFVEGILIRGDDDFLLDQKANCNRTLVCNNNDCRGETVLRSSAIKF